MRHHPASRGAGAIGATYPFAVRILARDAADAGAASARVYAWNTVGAIAGAVGGGFELLPVLELAGTVGLTAATSLVVVAAAGGVRPRRPAVAAVAAAGLLLLVVRPPATSWQLLRHSVLNPGAGQNPINAPEVVYYGVGRGATVMVLEQVGEWRLTTNGLPESTIQPPGCVPGVTRSPAGCRSCPSPPAPTCAV